MAITTKIVQFVDVHFWIIYKHVGSHKELPYIWCFLTTFKKTSYFQTHVDICNK